MIEKNREILSNAIKGMQTRSPKVSSWDDIAENLDHSDFSALLSESGKSLPRHKAPAGAWINIQKNLPPATSSFIASLTGKLISAFVIVGLVIGLYFLIPKQENNEIQSTKQPAKTSEINHSVKPSPVIEPPPVILTNDETILSEEKTIPVEEKAIPVEEKNSEIMSRPTEAEDLKFKEEGSSPLQLDKITSRSINRINHATQGKADQLAYTEAIKKTYAPDYFIKDPYKTRYCLGPYYSFNHFQEIDKEGMNIPQNLSSFGIEFMIEKHKWVFKTGIEYLGWKEKGYYGLDYTQNQLVYEYNYVDSTLIDPGSGNVTYFTSQRDVYDSVPGQVSGQASYQYRMLQIPLLVGYKLFDWSKFSIVVVGGIGFDIRISGKQFTPVFNEKDAIVDEINNSLQYRSENNWRLVGGFELGCRLSEKWNIYAEPTYQQYMSPMYVPDKSKGVGLFNLKAGIHFSF